MNREKPVSAPGAGVFYPWRRWLARTLDLFFYQVMWRAVLTLLFRVNFTGMGVAGSLLGAVVTACLMLCLEPLLLHLFGTTLGKAIFGLRVGTADGGRLSYSACLARTWGVFGMGMGYNIPIYNLICLWRSRSRCLARTPQPWDESVSYTIKDRKPYRGVLFACASAVAAFLLFCVVVGEAFPPNRGDLTVAEFSENYQHYADYLDIDFGNAFLDETGQWVSQDNPDAALYRELFGGGVPVYTYTTENGTVTGVSFSVEQTGIQDRLGYYDEQILLTSLALAGAQRETRLFSPYRREIAAQISDHTFQSFSFSAFGLVFTCETEFSGYTALPPAFLVPEDDATELWFTLHFSVHKQAR